MHRRRIHQESDEEEEEEEEDDEDETYNESPSFCEDSKISKPSLKKSKRNVEKRVVSFPIADVERSKSRGEVYPPSDSWAWRKYGQKPIKGSPYPRGYYRCSSSKGCPAKKQVERSRVDPTKLMITYASYHNHPFPSAANHKSHHHHNHRTATVVVKTVKKEEEEEEATVSAEKPAGLDLSHVDSPLLLSGYYSEIGEFGWFYDATISSSSSCSSSIYAGKFIDDITLEKEDQSLFGDLGDLPDCASVFRRGTVVTEEQHRRCDFGAIPFWDSSR